MASSPKRSRNSSTVESSSAVRSSRGSCAGPESSTLVSATPTSVIPRCSMSGCAASSRARAAASTVSVRSVGSPSVCERVARLKSSNRSRSVDRPRHAVCLAQPAGHPVDERDQRCVHGLGRLDRRPRACWAPIDRRRFRRSTRRGSRMCASACRCRAEALPSRSVNARTDTSATSRTVCSPASWSFCAVTSPTPHSRSTGSGCRNSSSRSAGPRAGRPASPPRSPPSPGTSCARRPR